MADNTVSQVLFEGGSTLVPMAALTNSGDGKTFTGAGKFWSDKPGLGPKIRPNGIITGGDVIPAAAAGNNNVDVPALTVYLAGVETAVGATTNVAASRGASNPFRITSITVNSAGSVVAVPGTEGTAFSATRGAAGGPPLIPATSVEVAQIQLSSLTAAPITAAQIFQVVGTHRERFDSPGWTVDPFDGKVVFDAALPSIHTGPVPKAVYAEYYTPIFTAIGKAYDFKPAENSASVGSVEYYGGTDATITSSLSACTFSVILQDGITDSLLAMKGQKVWIKYLQDRNKLPYIMTQGTLNYVRTFTKTAAPTAVITIAATEASRNYSS